MKEWIQIPAPDEESGPSYVLEARIFVVAVVARDRGR